MKRDEKNQQTRRRTLDRALSEIFGKGLWRQLSEHHLRCPGDLQGDRLSLFLRTRISCI